MTTKKRRRVCPGLGNYSVPKTYHTRLKRSTFQLNKDDSLDNNKIDAITDQARSLDLSRFYHLDLALACQLGKRCGKQLVSLNLAYCLITDQHLAAILDITHNNNIEKMDSASEGSVQSLSLRKLNLEHTPITDLGLRHIALNCPHLTSINLKGCQKITNLSLSLLAQHCKNLSRVELSDCKITNYAVQIIAQECKNNLSVLDITDCREITNDALSYLAFYCPNLKRLKLKGTRVTELGLMPLLQRVALLELNLQGLPISDLTLTTIAKNQKQLHLLNLSFCHSITLNALQMLIKTTPLLRELHLFGLANITNNNLNELSPLLQICS